MSGPGSPRETSSSSVDRAANALQTRDVDLERAVDGLGRRERLAVDLHHFVGLDLATVAEVMLSVPARGGGHAGPGSRAALPCSSATTPRT